MDTTTNNTVSVKHVCSCDKYSLCTYDTLTEHILNEQETKINLNKPQTKKTNKTKNKTSFL